MRPPEFTTGSSTGSFTSPAEADEVGRLVDEYDQSCQAALKAGTPAPPHGEFIAQAPPGLQAALRAILGRVSEEYANELGLPTVPGYQLLEEIGRGNMGVVYRARRQATEEVVALKRLEGGEEDRVERLEALLDLNHPNVVPVKGWFRHGGRVYLVMEFVEGKNLKARMGDFSLTGGLTPAEVTERKQAIAALLEPIARGVAALHRHLVLHRDLKPANVLIGQDGTPRVCDFGLMRRLGQDLSLTPSNALVGTLQYMAPEQANPHGRAQTVVADVYALGAILFELLTGRPPFCDKERDLVMLLQMKLGANPHLPDTHKDCDLGWICLKCLQINPAERYPSAEALADALLAYQRGERVRDGESLWHMFRRLTRPLELSPVDPEYIERWRPTLRIEACTSFVCHLVVFLLAFNEAAGARVWLWYFLTDPLLGWLDWLPFLRSRRLTPLEQHVMQLWIGADLAAAVLFMATVPFWGPVTPAAVAPFYVGYAVIRGLTFFVEGRSCWGRLYLVGLAFFAAALVMPHAAAFAPLIHGTMYSGWFLWLSFQDWRTTRPVLA